MKNQTNAVSAHFCTEFGTDKCVCVESDEIEISGGLCSGKTTITDCANDKEHLDSQRGAINTLYSAVSNVEYENWINLMIVRCAQADGEFSAALATEEDFCKAVTGPRCERKRGFHPCSALSATNPVLPECCSSCEANIENLCSGANVAKAPAVCRANGCDIFSCQMIGGASSVVALPSVLVAAVVAFAALML